MSGYRLEPVGERESVAAVMATHEGMARPGTRPRSALLRGAPGALLLRNAAVCSHPSAPGLGRPFARGCGPGFGRPVPGCGGGPGTKRAGSRPLGLSPPVLTRAPGCGSPPGGRAAARPGPRRRFRLRTGRRWPRRWAWPLPCAVRGAPGRRALLRSGRGPGPLGGIPGSPLPCPGKAGVTGCAGARPRSRPGR